MLSLLLLYLLLLLLPLRACKHWASFMQQTRRTHHQLSRRFESTGEFALRKRLGRNKDQWQTIEQKIWQSICADARHQFFGLAFCALTPWALFKVAKRERCELYLWLNNVYFDLCIVGAYAAKYATHTYTSSGTRTHQHTHTDTQLLLLLLLFLLPPEASDTICITTQKCKVERKECFAFFFCTCTNHVPHTHTPSYTCTHT